MKRFLTMCFAIGFLTANMSLNVCRADDAKVVDGYYKQYLKRQSILDMWAFNFAAIIALRKEAADASLEWVVAENKPGMLTPGDAGQVPSSFYFIEGMLEVKNGIDREAAEAVIPYKMKVQRFSSNRDRRIDALRSSNIEICAVDPTKDGNERIRLIFLLPPGWEKYVKPGWEYYAADSALFDPSEARRNLSRLQGLIQNKNPFIAVGAFRTLLYGQAVDTQWVRKTIHSTKGVQREVFEKLADSSVYKW